MYTINTKRAQWVCTLCKSRILAAVAGSGWITTSFFLEYCRNRSFFPNSTAALNSVTDVSGWWLQEWVRLLTSVVVELVSRPAQRLYQDWGFSAVCTPQLRWHLMAPSEDTEDPPAKYPHSAVSAVKTEQNCLLKSSALAAASDRSWAPLLSGDTPWLSCRWLRRPAYRQKGFWSPSSKPRDNIPLTYCLFSSDWVAFWSSRNLSQYWLLRTSDPSSYTYDVAWC